MVRTATISVGDKFKSRHYGSFTVLEYISSRNIHIQFDGTGTIVVTNSTAIYKGQVKDPYLPTVAGVGFPGIGKFSSTKTPKVYQLWLSMLQRVYYSQNKNHKRYKDCKVVKRWHDLQNFGSDITKMKNWNTPGFELDKDLRVLGNKKYGPKYCSFVPAQLNSYVGQIQNSKGLRTYIDSSNFYASNMVNGKRKQRSFATVKDAKAYYLKEVCRQLSNLLRKYSKRLHEEVVGTITSFIRKYGVV